MLDAVHRLMRLSRRAPPMNDDKEIQNRLTKEPHRLHFEVISNHKEGRSNCFCNIRKEGIATAALQLSHPSDEEQSRQSYCRSMPIKMTQKRENLFKNGIVNQMCRSRCLRPSR
jgi:hypothetical protein